MSWALAVLFGLAALLQLAVHAAPDIHEAPLRARARRVKIAALMLLCAYFVWSASQGHRDHPWLLFALLLACLSELGFTTERLFPGKNNRRHCDKGPRHE